MSRVPTSLRILPEARDALESIAQHNPDHAEPILRKIRDWEEHISWDRAPQEHLTYLTASGAQLLPRASRQRRLPCRMRNIRRPNAVVAVLPKGNDTYDLDVFEQRVDRD